MAVISGYNPNQDNNSNNDNQNAGQPVSVSGASAPTTSNTPGAGSNNPNTPTSSGRFTNLSNYLNANKGNNLANQMGSTFQSKYNDLSDELNKSNTDFNDKANQGRNQYDQGFVQKAIDDPTAYTGNNTDYQKFEGMRTGGYTGPTGMDNVAQLQNDASNYQTLGNQTATEQGRFNLLKNFYDTPTYNQGQQSLDNLFLQADPTASQQLAQYRGLGNSLNNTVNTTANNAANTVQNYKNEAVNTNTQVNKDLQTGLSNFSDSLTPKIEAARQGNDQLLADLNAGNLTGEDLNKIGLTQDQLNEFNMYKGNGGQNPFTLQSYYNAIDPTAQNVASADDYNKYAALSKLAGTTPTFLSDPSQAGSFNKMNPLNLNQFQTDLGAVENSYQTAAQPLIDQYNGFVNMIHPNDGFNDAEQRFKNNVINPNPINGKDLNQVNTNITNLLNAFKMTPMEQLVNNVPGSTNAPTNYTSFYGPAGEGAMSQLQALQKLIQSYNPSVNPAVTGIHTAGQGGQIRPRLG